MNAASWNTGEPDDDEEVIDSEQTKDDLEADAVAPPSANQTTPTPADDGDGTKRDTETWETLPDAEPPRPTPGPIASGTFEEIAEAQGWDVHQQLDLLRQYVANQDDEAALSDFAERAAAEEQEAEASK